MKEIKNIVIFNSTKDYGTTKGKDGLEARKTIANEMGFDIKNLFMPCEPNKNHPCIPGTSYTLTTQDKADYDDLYQYDVYANTIKLTRKTPGIVIGFNVSDAANMIMANTKTGEVTTTFCSGANINNYVPFTVPSTLGGDREDIIVNLSPFAHTYIFNGTGELKEPTWISNKDVWNDCISEQNGILYIDQLKALKRQLLMAGVKEENIFVGEDSLENPKYFSSQRARLSSNPSQEGRFMHCAMYESEEKEYNLPYKRYSLK